MGNMQTLLEPQVLLGAGLVSGTFVKRCFPEDDNQINVKERPTQMSSDMLTDVRVKFGVFTTRSGPYLAIR